MFEKLNEYIDTHFKLMEINEKPLSLAQFMPIGYHRFALKNVPDETRQKFEKMCKQNGLGWKIDVKTQFGYVTPLSKEQSENLYKYLCEKVKVDNKILKNYCDFLTYFNGVGTCGLGIYGVELNMKDYALKRLLSQIDIFRPYSMQNLLVIGKWMKDYACLNADGEVLIYDSKVLDKLAENLDDMIDYWEGYKATSKNAEKLYAHAKAKEKNFYESEVPIVSYWSSLESFVTEAVISANELYLKEPFHLTPKDFKIHNLTPEIVSKLESEGKITPGMVR